jgi:hypothetical protein
MPLTVNSNAVYDAFVNLIDTINREPDPVGRLSLLLYADNLYKARFLTERDRAAYEARQHYPINRVAGSLEVNPSHVYYWANRFQEATGAPSLSPRKRFDLMGAEDLSHLRLARRDGSESGIVDGD